MTRSFPTNVAGMALATFLSQQATTVQGLDSDVYDVRELYNTCSVAPDSADYTVATYACLAFIGGAVQYHDAVSDRKHLKRLICYPKGATVTDGRAAFVAWGTTTGSRTASGSQMARRNGRGSGSVHRIGRGQNLIVLHLGKEVD